MTHELNLSYELAQLLEYVADVAVTIRTNTPHRIACSHRKQDEVESDVAWLADALHNFDMLGQAVREGEIDRIVFACDMLSGSFQQYTATAPKYRHEDSGRGSKIPEPSCAVFARERNRRCNPQRPITLFAAIRSKALNARNAC